MGLSLPQWTKSVYPESMRELAIKTFETETGTVNLRRLAAGYLLKKIVDDTKNTLTRWQTNKKMHLYSGYRFNIAHLLTTLDIFDQEITPYGSYVAFEVHRINGVGGIKIFYGKYEGAPAQMKLPDCSEFCPFQHFSAIAEEYRPPEGICGTRWNTY